MTTIAPGRKSRERQRLRADRIQLEHDAGGHQWPDPLCAECVRCVEDLASGCRFVPAVGSDPARCACGSWSETPNGHRTGGSLTEKGERMDWWEHAARRAMRRASEWPNEGRP